LKLQRKTLLYDPTGVQFALGLSVGGVILWRASQKGLSIGNLLCFSSARLRFEKHVPNCISTNLYFGETDTYRPGAKWFQDLGLPLNLVPGAGHDTLEKQRIINSLNDKPAYR
jgi:hypothetical protein